MKTVSAICLLTAAAVAAPTFTGPAAENISQGDSGSFANVSSALLGKRDLGNATLPTVTNVTAARSTAQAEKRQIDETLPSLNLSSLSILAVPTALAQGEKRQDFPSLDFSGLSIPAVPTALAQSEKKHIGLDEALPSLDLPSPNVPAIPTASIASLSSSSIV